MSHAHLAGSLRGTVNRNAVSGYAPGTLLVTRAEVVDDASHIVVLYAVERRAGWRGAILHSDGTILELPKATIDAYAAVYFPLDLIELGQVVLKVATEAGTK